MYKKYKTKASWLAEFRTKTKNRCYGWCISSVHYDNYFTVYLETELVSLRLVIAGLQWQTNREGFLNLDRFHNWNYINNIRAGRASILKIHCHSTHSSIYILMFFSNRMRICQK